MSGRASRALPVEGGCCRSDPRRLRWRVREASDGFVEVLTVQETVRQTLLRVAELPTAAPVFMCAARTGGPSLAIPHVLAVAVLLGLTPLPVLVSPVPLSSSSMSYSYSLSSHSCLPLPDPEPLVAVVAVA